MARQDVGRIAAVTAVFALAGPLIGATGALVVSAIQMEASDTPFGLVMLLMWPFAVVIGVMIGFIPAAVTGALMALASPRLRTAPLWVGTSALCGAVATAIIHRLAGQGSDALLVVGAGTGAAVLCALITLGWRPRAAYSPNSPA